MKKHSILLCTAAAALCCLGLSCDNHGEAQDAPSEAEASPASLAPQKGWVKHELTHSPDYYWAPQGERLRFEIDKGNKSRWYFNDQPLTHNDNRPHLDLPGVVPEMAGEYTVHYEQKDPGDGRDRAPVSKTVYLLVYSHSSRGPTVQGNGGTLTVPVGAFSGWTFRCNPNDTNSFTHGYSLSGSTTPQFFYGPKVLNQSGPFVNSTANALNLKVWVENSTAITAAQIRRNKVPMTNECCTVNPTEMRGCRVLLNGSELASEASYRGAIFYYGTLSTNITVKWWYSP